MPAIQAKRLAQMAKLNFKANAIMLPEQFKGFATWKATTPVVMAVGMGGMLQ